MIKSSTICLSSLCSTMMITVMVFLSCEKDSFCAKKYTQYTHVQRKLMFARTLSCSNFGICFLLPSSWMQCLWKWNYPIKCVDITLSTSLQMRLLPFSIPNHLIEIYEPIHITAFHCQADTNNCYDNSKDGTNEINITRIHTTTFQATTRLNISHMFLQAQTIRSNLYQWPFRRDSWNIQQCVTIY